jgi:hypothetical protein
MILNLWPNLRGLWVIVKFTQKKQRVNFLSNSRYVPVLGWVHKYTLHTHMDTQIHTLSLHTHTHTHTQAQTHPLSLHTDTHKHKHTHSHYTHTHTSTNTPTLTTHIHTQAQIHPLSLHTDTHKHKHTHSHYTPTHTSTNTHRAERWLLAVFTSSIGRKTLAPGRPFPGNH